MIIPTYAQARHHFHYVSWLPFWGTVADDGLPSWPGPSIRGDGTFRTFGSRLRLSNFDAAHAPLVAETAGGTVFLPVADTEPILAPSQIPPGDVCWPIKISIGPTPTPADAVPGVHEYDWFLSQRRDPGLYLPVGTTSPIHWDEQALVLTMTEPTSGVVYLSPNLAALAKLLPGRTGADLLTEEAFGLIFMNAALYVQRRADKTIQWARLFGTWTV